MNVFIGFIVGVLTTLAVIYVPKGFRWARAKLLSWVWTP